MTETPTLKQWIAGQRISEPGPLFDCWLEMFSPIAARASLAKLRAEK